jgi:predicted nucleic acid-binding Zn ribbon protein
MSQKSYKFKKYVDNEENPIYPHKHCPVCNRMIEPELQYCSEACEKLIKTKDKRQKRKLYIIILSIVGASVGLVLVMTIIGSL